MVSRAGGTAELVPIVRVGGRRSRVELSELLEQGEKGNGNLKEWKNINSRGLDCEDPRVGPRAGWLV